MAPGALPLPPRRLNVLNPASTKVLAKVPLSPAAEVNEAADVAARAFVGWRRTPVGDRIHPLFKLKRLLEANREDIAHGHHQRVRQDSALRAGPKCSAPLRMSRLPAACPMMMQGVNNEDIAAGIDEHMIRQPLGVVAAITPFNFPGMIPFWFLPYAVAAGNCFLLKPSERVPITSQKLFHLI